MKYLSAHKNILIIILVFLNLIAGGSFAYVAFTGINKSELAAKDSELLTKQQAIASLVAQIKKINADYTSIESTDAQKQIASLNSQLDTINAAFSEFSSIQTLINTAKNDGIDITTFSNSQSSIQSELLAGKFSDAKTAEDNLNTSITNSINQKKAAQAAASQSTPVATTPSNLPGSSFTSTTVTAQGQRYNIDYITIDLTSPGLKIITDTMQSTDCSNNCQATNLMYYYNKDHGFAAINGTYLCPADYSSCANQTNSFDFPVYNTNIGQWINKANLFWVGRAMLAFNGTTPTFYPNANSYSGADQFNQTYPPVTAAFVMAPGLVYNGQVIVNNYTLDSKSATVLSTRGAVGIKGNSIIIADAFGCTVPQMAYIMQALGVTNAISVDGGGSTAMIYNGQYMLGPGRNIPNAIIFSR